MLGGCEVSGLKFSVRVCVVKISIKQRKKRKESMHCASMLSIPVQRTHVTHTHEEKEKKRERERERESNIFFFRSDRGSIDGAVDSAAC